VIVKADDESVIGVLGARELRADEALLLRMAGANACRKVVSRPDPGFTFMSVLRTDMIYLTTSD